MLNLNPASVLWIVLNTAGLWYVLLVYFRARTRYFVIRDYDPPIAERVEWARQRRAVMFQGRLNVTVAFLLSLTLGIFLALGLFTMIARPGVLYYGYVFQLCLIAGDAILVAVAWQLNNGQKRLHRLVDSNGENTDKG